MTFREMHNKRHITWFLVPTGPNAGKIRFDPLDSVGDRFLAEAGKNIAAYKEEIESIREELKAQKAANEAQIQARLAKIDAIEGLKELQRYEDEWANYQDAFGQMMDDENNDGARPPKCPQHTVMELAARYPRAAAYLTAQHWYGAAHHVKSSAGSKARGRIINGEDYKQVIADMKAEWSAYCDEHMWD